MLCVNPNCGQEVEPGSQFCTHCGTSQPKLEKPAGEGLQKMAAIVQSLHKPELPTMQSSHELLVMRADESIWNFTEDEGQVIPGHRRPVLILDEEVTHLSDTDKCLSMEELHYRVKSRLDEYQVPVDVGLVNVRWLNDEKEVRQRLVASMRNHPFNDIKLIMGLDYMGKWASFQVYLGMEPDIAPDHKQKQMFIAFAAAAAGLALGLMTGHTWLLAVGAIAAAFGFFLWRSSKKLSLAAAQKAQEKHFRSYKIDDARLFCQAMQGVYKWVIDDIVESGGTVVRVEGGKGGFFTGSGTGTQAPTERLSNAAEAAV